MTLGRVVPLIALLWALPVVGDDGETPTIEVTGAKYGAQALFCNAQQPVADLCDGKQECVFQALSKYVCPDGENPISGVQKRLTVRYRCGKTSRKVKATQRQTVELNCETVAYRIAEASAFVGHVFDPAASGDPGCSGALSDDTGSAEDSTASCVRLCAELPPGATVKRVHGWVRLANKNKWRPCHNDPVSCDTEQAAFYGEPDVEHEGAHTQICWIFRNWSLEINREARVTVDYDPYDEP